MNTHSAFIDMKTKVSPQNNKQNGGWGGKDAGSISGMGREGQGGRRGKNPTRKPQTNKKLKKHVKDHFDSGFGLAFLLMV